MLTFSKALIALALDSSDRSVLSQAAGMVELCSIGEVELLHVLNLPPNVDDATTHQALKSCAEELDQVALEFKKMAPAGVQVLSRVAEGRPFRIALLAAKDEGFDLICLGRATYGPVSRLGTDAGTIIRKAPCSVFIVPQDSERFRKHILVPVDFSERCREALEFALGLARKSGAKVTIDHVYEVPVGFHATGKTFEEFAESMRHNAEVAWQEFAEDLDLSGVEHTVRLDLDPQSHLSATHHAKRLNEVVNEIDPDLVVLASQGRQGGAGLLLGSSAARLVSAAERPVLVLRRPGDNVSLLQALFHL